MHPTLAFWFVTIVAVLTPSLALPGYRLDRQMMVNPSQVPVHQLTWEHSEAGE